MHMPKTGGMWINDVCRSLTVPTDGMPVLYLDVDHRVNIDTQGKQVFTFVRNPWTWYVSFYQHQLRRGAIAGYAYQTDEQLDFTSFLYRCIEMPLWMRVKAWQMYRDSLEQILSAVSREKQNRLDGIYNPITYEIDFQEAWVKNNSVLDLYSFMVAQYTKKAKQIGRMESMAQDLATMLTLSGELTAEVQQRMANTPPVNTGNISDYREFYTNETHDLVADRCAAVISRFNYEF
jgi:hypothetical protein